MSEVVLDASAVLALLHEEEGHLIVRDYVANSIISTVNLAEVLGKLSDVGINTELAAGKLQETGIVFIPFSEKHASITSELRTITKSFGLSLGDRACLALALERNLFCLTADKQWTKITKKLAVRIRYIR